MNKVDFDKLMQGQMKDAQGKTLLLHCCCAPCSSACLERLKDVFKITVLFYNPNIEDGEYKKRHAGLQRRLNANRRAAGMVGVPDTHQIK